MTLTWDLSYNSFWKVKNYSFLNAGVSGSYVQMQYCTMEQNLKILFG